MMDTIVDADGTAFICPECTFNGSSLPELIHHLNQAHGEELTNQNETVIKNPSPVSNEKRSRRKPAFSHQIISQGARPSLPLHKQSNVDPGSIHFWNRVMTADQNDRRFSPVKSNVIRDENRIHSHVVSPQRPIAPKVSNTTPTKAINSIPIHSSPPPMFPSAIQPIQKNFQCRICHLTYKNFHDCTAHIRRKHEISHAQAGRYVGKLDTNVPLPPSATGHYKIRLKVKSLPPQPITTIENYPKTYQCKYCPYKNSSLKELSQHETQRHRNYSSFTQNDVSNNNYSALLIDNVQSCSEVIPNENDEMIIIEEDLDDDEDEALWKYQQEINNLSDSTMNNNQNNHHMMHSNMNSLTKTFKKFQCPHCEHSSPTLTKLKLHIATHINVKPFMCSVCGWRANLRWYIQCHAKKRHPNQNFEVLQLSHEEAEQTINAYMRERNCDTKLYNRHDSKHQYQCSLCQFRSNHPRFIEQHIEANHTKIIKTNTNHSNGTLNDINSHQSTFSSNVVYQNFSSHPNFNPNRLYYCSLCYRGYRWRYDVKRHHKTMHETPDDDMMRNRNFHYLEYVPQIDCLVTATMSSMNNQTKHDNDNGEHEQITNNDNNNNHNNCEQEDDEEDDLKLSIADARTVDINEDETAALLMNVSDKSEVNPIVIEDHPEDSIIVFDDDRVEKSTVDVIKLSSRSSFKPYQCPYCFYRTNWRTDCLRHIRARHKIEPNQNGYYELSNEDAEKTYDEYERTYGFVVSKKVLARFTEFRHIEWEDLKKSIWDKIKDKTDFEQCIIDRLRPNDYTPMKSSEPIIQTPIVTIPNKIPTTFRTKRMFTCMTCAFRSHKVHELEKHICLKVQKFQQEKSHGKFVVSIYECTKCSYRTFNSNYARNHIYLHRLKDFKKKSFYSCSFCGYNHRYRTKVLVHIAKYHPNKNSSNSLMSCQHEFDAEFSIRQTVIRRSFIERQLKKERSFYCLDCPYISTSIVEHDHHLSFHNFNPLNSHKCLHCSFSSNSLFYTKQHMLIHSDEARAISSNVDMKNLKRIPVSIIYKEILGKPRRYKCPFCKRLTSGSSTTILNHIKNIHAGNSKQFNDNLIVGSDIAKEILLL